MTVSEQGLSGVYLTMVVDCRIPAFEQLWVFERPNLLQTGKINFPTEELQGLSSVYLALVFDCKIPTFVKRCVYNRPNFLPTVEKVIFRQWMYKIHPVSI